MSRNVCIWNICNNDRHDDTIRNYLYPQVGILKWSHRHRNIETGIMFHVFSNWYNILGTFRDNQLRSENHPVCGIHGINSIGCWEQAVRHILFATFSEKQRLLLKGLIMDRCVLLTSTPECVVSPRGETTHQGVDVNNPHLSMVNPDYNMMLAISARINQYFAY